MPLQVDLWDCRRPPCLSAFFCLQVMAKRFRKAASSYSARLLGVIFFENMPFL